MPPIARPELLLRSRRVLFSNTAAQDGRRSLFAFPWLRIELLSFDHFQPVTNKFLLNVPAPECIAFSLRPFGFLTSRSNAMGRGSRGHYRF